MYHNFWPKAAEKTIGPQLRYLVVITGDANELVSQIRNLMPLILAPSGFKRWLGEEPDPRDLQRLFPKADIAEFEPVSLRRRGRVGL
ncbi:MAG: SOS response-associated peptidase family protein [Xanthobacteraceae bacterium]